VHWGRREQLYITPVGENEVNVALLTSHRGRRVCDALPDFPEIAWRVRNAAATSTARGAVTRTRTLRQVVRGNVAVLGDASGSVDAITGEGLLSAFRQAHALADALAEGKPECYAAAHRRIAKNPRRMARLLLLLDRHPQLQRRFIALLARQPETFAALLRVHLNEQSWPRFAAHRAAGLLAGSFSPEHTAHPWARPRKHPWYASPAASGRRERGI
jgi:flavin-dependent dehydrogenase